MRSIVKRILHLGGSTLAALGVTFVALRLHDYSTAIDFSRFDGLRWLAVVGLALIYGTANLMLVLAWRNLLAYLGTNISHRWAVKTYGISQLAKYVPGNIFHLAGRQAMGMAAEVPGWTLAKSSMWELGLISFTGGLLGVLVLPLLMPSLPVAASEVIFVGITGMVTTLLWHFIGLQVTFAFIWYVGFLAISGLLFSGLIALQTGRFEILESNWAALCGAYVLAWVIGLIIPGAPAGVGVRELVLLFLLKDEVDQANLVLVVLIARIVTVIGDLLFFVTASILPKTSILKG